VLSAICNSAIRHQILLKNPVESALKNVGGHSRRVYKITSAGRKALDKASAKVDELHHELHEDHPRKVSPLSDSSAKN
jgi:PadR family transcriptional regulator, regulatory protein PadR